MQIVMLGTGHGKALNCYNYCFLIKINNTNLLVDCGGSIQIITQLIKANTKIEDIDNIFISHSHMDHILGLIWIIRYLCPKYCNGLIKKNIFIYGNEDVINKLYNLIALFIPKDFNEIIKNRIKFIKLINNQSFRISDATITVFDIKSKNIKEYGFKLNYKNNNIIYLGDEKYSEINKRYIANCDYAFMDARDIINSNGSSHSTVKDSAIIAQKYNIKNLILSHSNDNDLKNRRDIFRNEAAKYYKGNIYVPNDLDKIEIE